MAMAPRGLRPPWPPGPPYTTMFLSPPSQSHHYYNDDTFISLKISIISAILQVFLKKIKKWPVAPSMNSFIKASSNLTGKIC
jgi:hypothetical protein